MQMYRVITHASWCLQYFATVTKPAWRNWTPSPASGYSTASQWADRIDSQSSNHCHPCDPCDPYADPRSLSWWTSVASTSLSCCAFDSTSLRSRVTVLNYSIIQFARFRSCQEMSRSEISVVFASLHTLALFLEIIPSNFHTCQPFEKNTAARVRHGPRSWVLLTSLRLLLGISPKSSSFTGLFYLRLSFAILFSQVLLRILVQVKLKFRILNKSSPILIYLL